MKKSIIIPLFFASVISAFGQNIDASEGNRNFELSWAPSFYQVRFDGNPYQEFKQEFPNSLLANSPESFQSSTSFARREFWGAGPFLSFEFGKKVNLIHSDKLETTWRFSNDIGGVELGFGGINYQPTFIDSTKVYINGNEYSGSNEMVQSDAWNVTLKGVNVSVLTDLIVRFRGDKQFSFYSGLGLGAGSTLGTKTSIKNIVREFHEFSSSETNIYTSNGNRIYKNEINASEIKRETQVLKTKAALSTFIYVPFGVDFALAKSGFWSRNSIFLEGQIGIRFNDMLLGRSGVYKHLSHSAGYRFVF